MELVRYVMLLPVFVGDLAADITDFELQETFRAHYQSVKGARVVIDRATGSTKGYGFVWFSDESEQVRAIQEMNGNGAASYKSNQAIHGDSDPNNTTIFVGNLDTYVTEELLRQVFTLYGELVHVKIVAGKQCGFVQFVNRSSAEEAIRILNGAQLGGLNLRLSWGDSPSIKQTGAVQPQWNAAQDPNMSGDTRIQTTEKDLESDEAT